MLSGIRRHPRCSLALPPLCDISPGSPAPVVRPWTSWNFVAAFIVTTAGHALPRNRRSSARPLINSDHACCFGATAFHQMRHRSRRRLSPTIALCCLTRLTSANPSCKRSNSSKRYLDPERWANQRLGVQPMCVVPMTATPAGVNDADVIRLEPEDRENAGLDNASRLPSPQSC